MEAISIGSWIWIGGVAVIFWWNLALGGSETDPRCVAAFAAIKDGAASKAARSSNPVEREEERWPT